MLNEFLEVLHSTEMKKQANRELVDALKNLPAQELFDLANGKPSGSIKLAYLGDPSCDWLSKYKGTPLFDQAVALEEQLLQIEAQEQQQRQVDRQNQQLWEARDRICLQKRVLDLELVRAQQPQSGAPEEELEAAEGAGLALAQEAHETEQAQNAAPQAPPQAQRPPAPKGPPKEEESEEKEASARRAEVLENIRSMDKLARALAHADFKKMSMPVQAMIPLGAAVGGGVGGAAYGSTEGEPVKGAIRGAAGGGLGALAGGVGGQLLAGLSTVPQIYRAIRQGGGSVDPDAIRAAATATAMRRSEVAEPAGQLLGGLIGVHKATQKYDAPPQAPVEEKTPVATKEANLLGSAVNAGKNLLTGAKAALPGIQQGISQGAQRLGSAVQNGGLTGGLKAMGRMGANFAKQNPLAAAGVAGGAGLAAGAALS